uniref:Ovule protein n=1 Tax=Strongyloides venezuelensis TaxID=75913 RepID=A0A0K0F1G6_STRVS
MGHSGLLESKNNKVLSSLKIGWEIIHGVKLDTVPTLMLNFLASSRIVVVELRSTISFNFSFSRTFTPLEFFFV